MPCQVTATPGTSKIGTSRIGSAKIGTSKIGTSKIGSAKISTSKIGSAKIGTKAVGAGSSKISAKPAGTKPTFSLPQPGGGNGSTKITTGTKRVSDLYPKAVGWTGSGCYPRTIATGWSYLGAT